MTAEIDLGNYEIDEDSNGDLVIKDTNDNTVLKWDDGNGNWTFNSNNIVGVSQLTATDADISNLVAALDTNNNDVTDSGTTVYDASTDTVGDGTTSADHQSVNTDDQTINNSLDATGLTLSTDPSNPTTFISHSADNEEVSHSAVKTSITGDNTAQSLISIGGSLLIVSGQNGDGGEFTDVLIAQSREDNVSVISSEMFNAGARNYSYNSGTIELAIDDSGTTYDCVVDALSSVAMG